MLIGAAALLLPAVASGEPDTAIAEQLFRDGRSLIESGRIDEACEKFSASQRLAPALGTQLNLALCREKQGKTATAWSLFIDVEAEAQRRGDAVRTAIAHEHRIALESLLKKVVVDVPAAPPGTVVKLDETVLPAAALGTEIPLDPGNHRLTVTAPGKKTWEQSNLSLDGGATTAHVRVELEDEGAPSGVPGPKPSPATGSVVPPPPSTPSPSTAPIAEAPGSIPSPRESPFFSPESTPSSNSGARPNVKRIASFALAGAGIVSLGVASYYGLTAISRRNDESRYPSGTSQRLTVYNEAKTAQTYGFVFCGVGVAALAAGAVLFFTSIDHPARLAGTWQLTPSIAPGFAGGTLGGVF